LLQDSTRTKFSSLKETVLDGSSNQNATAVCKDMHEQSGYSFTNDPPIKLPLTEVSDDSKKINCIYFPNKWVAIQILAIGSYFAET